MKKNKYVTPQTEVYQMLVTSALAGSKTNDYVIGGGSGVPSAKVNDWNASECDEQNEEW